MNTESKAAKNLNVGEWVRTMGSVYVVMNVDNYGNGWVRVDLTDGRSMDCLAGAMVPLA